MAEEKWFASQVAAKMSRRLGRTVSPREDLALFYDRVIPEELAPVVGGRRMIPASVVATFESALRSCARRQPRRV